MPLRCKVFARLNNCANCDEADVPFVQTKKKNAKSLFSFIGHNFYLLRDDFKTHLPVDQWLRPVPGGWHCLEQSAGTAGRPAVRFWSHPSGYVHKMCFWVELLQVLCVTWLLRHRLNIIFFFVAGLCRPLKRCHHSQLSPMAQLCYDCNKCLWWLTLTFLKMTSILASSSLQT